jgi:hypothetical protein
MPEEPALIAIDVELRRVTNRLETTSVTKLNENVALLVHSAAESIIRITTDPQRPANSGLPTLGPTALAAQLTVVVNDYLDMRTAASEDAAVAEILIDLRRSLP